MKDKNLVVIKSLVWGRLLLNRCLIIALILCCNHAFASANDSAGTHITYHTQATITDVMKHIMENTEYSIFYKSEDIDASRVVRVDINSASINDIMQQALANTDLAYRIEDKNIVIYKKTEHKELSQAIKQENSRVTGVVKDDLGDPIIGATVMIKNSNKGTVTDHEGRYEIQASNKDIIEFSFIGFKKKAITYKGEGTINITLSEDSELLDEVVVVGYGVQKKANLSGAVASISDSAIKNRPVTNATQALQGVAGNLNITINSGQATASPTINIRGLTSLNGGGPLIVIDGIVSSDGDLKDINPSDIKDISVLKDASSAAIYGARAAFGVIIVTTKGGAKKGPEKISINYDNNVSFRKLSVRPDIVTDPATVVDMKNIFSKPWYNLYDENAIEYAKKRSADPSISPYYLTPKGDWQYFGNTNWFDEAYKDWGFSTNHNVNISGATEKVSYYVSAGYQRTNGMLKQDNDIFNRYNFRSKLDFKITDRWSISNNTSYSSTDYDAPTYLGSDYYWAVSRKNPLDVPRNPDGSWTETGADILGRMQDGGRSKDLYQRFQTQFSTKIDIFKDIWTVNGNFAINRYSANSEWATLSVPYSKGPEMATSYYNVPNSASESTSRTDNIIFDLYTNFTYTFKEKHFLNVMAGFNQEEEKYKYFKASRNDLISEALPNLGLATGEKNVGSSRSEYALRGFFYRVNYIFNNRYIFEHNGRYDGTSRFHKDDRFVYNPSVSVAWVASQEAFFDKLKPIVSHLKFRLSYGSLGNQSVGNYSYIPTMGKGQTSWILDDNQPIFVKAPGLVSSGLTWETVVTKNFGMDLNFFDNRLTTSFDYYFRDTKDMLVAGSPLPNVLGTSVPKENAANLRTKGWELNIGWNDQFKLAGKPFNYYAKLILSDNQSKITKFSNPTGTLNSYYKGQKYGEMWGLTTLGYFTSMDDVAKHADQTAVTAQPGTFKLGPGDLKFADLNGDDKIDWGSWTLADHGDYRVIGNTTPRYNFGINLGFEWNNIDFSIFIQGVGKRDYYPGPSDLYFWGVNSQPWANITKGNMNYWTEDRPNAYFPRRKAYTAEQSDRELGATQTKYMQSAAYGRLKNLTIGYTLPKEITRKIRIENLRFFLSGENLAEISGLDKHYKVDPEGLGGQMYPLSRVVSFGLNVGF